MHLPQPLPRIAHNKCMRKIMLEILDQMEAFAWPALYVFNMRGGCEKYLQFGTTNISCHGDKGRCFLLPKGERRIGALGTLDSTLGASRGVVFWVDLEDSGNSFQSSSKLSAMFDLI